MSRQKQNYPKLRFKVYQKNGQEEGEFVWGSKRQKVFERYYSAREIEDRELVLLEMSEILADDPEFLDAYNEVGWMQIDMYNYGIGISFFKMAFRIGANLIPEDFKGAIPWVMMENRPYLSVMHGLGYAHTMIGEYEQADKIYQHLLAYNPLDNQGIRAFAVENHLYAGNYKGVLKICKLFPDDTLPELLYGKVIALYQLGQMDKAKAALGEAARYAPNVINELRKKKHKEVKPKAFDDFMGGSESEAFDFWKRTRILWNDLALLKFVTGAATEG